MSRIFMIIAVFRLRNIMCLRWCSLWVRQRTWVELEPIIL